MRCRVKLNGNKVREAAVVSDITVQNKFSFIRKIANVLIRKVSKKVSSKSLEQLMDLNCKKMKDKIQKSAKVKRRCRTLIKDMHTDTDSSSSPAPEKQNANKKAGNPEIYAPESKEERARRRAINKKRCIDKIKHLRSLKHYKEIESFLNEGKLILAKEAKTVSLNCIIRKSKNNPWFWNHYVYVAKQIEHCIYKHDWNNLTRFLIIFANFSSAQKQYLLEASLINFAANPVSQTHALLEDYLKECFSCRDQNDIRQLLTDFFHINLRKTE